MSVSESSIISIWEVVVAITLTLVLSSGVLLTMNSNEIKAQTLSNAITYNTILSNGHNTKISLNTQEENFNIQENNNQLLIITGSEIRKERSYFGEKKSFNVEGQTLIIS